MMPYPVVEAPIAELRGALESGATTSVELTRAYLARIEAYDQNGIRLNAVVELNPDALAEAEESDRRRAAGDVRGPLEGIPYTAKRRSVRRRAVSAACRCWLSCKPASRLGREACLIT